MLTIDGSHGSGSGQLVRAALTLSTLTKTPIHIINIRKSRPSPGLKPQHFTAVQALQQIAQAEVKNLKPNTTELIFIPQSLQGITGTFDIGTAGSITLLIQNTIIPLMFADSPSKITLIGGTDVPFAPSFDYCREVFFQYLKPYIKKINIEIINRGFYPKGQGKVTLEITPKYKLSEFKNFQAFHEYLLNLNQPLDCINQGKITMIEGNSLASSSLQKAQVAERQKQIAEKVLIHYPLTMYDSYETTASIGSVITLWAKTSTSCILGADTLGKKGITAEEIGKTCAQTLLNEINTKACVDQHLADQLIPLLVVYGGSLKTSRLTEHLHTNVWIHEQFLGKCFKIDEKEKIITFKK